MRRPFAQFLKQVKRHAHFHIRIAGTSLSKAIRDKLQENLFKAMNLPETREIMNRQGAEIVTNTPEEFLRFVQEEITKFGPVVKTAGLKME